MHRFRLFSSSIERRHSMTNAINRPPPKNSLRAYGAKANAIAAEIDEFLKANPHWFGDIFIWLCEERDVARAYGYLLNSADPRAYLDDWIDGVRAVLAEIADDDAEGGQP
jgi:hypothetical protein